MIGLKYFSTKDRNIIISGRVHNNIFEYIHISELCMNHK